jgi:hypothetical protein
MQGLTDEGQRSVRDVAQRHGVSADAVFSLLLALVAGRGTQAQFSHPELGGMGQWSQGGMIMVGDMFNNGLKARVDALCNEVSALLRSTTMFADGPSAQSQDQSQRGSGTSLFVSGTSSSRWPTDLGTPSSTGSQNDLHYAVFPSTHRLVIEQAGRMTVYDIGDHLISGFSQQQSGDQSITFTSQHGLVRVADLRVVDSGAQTPSVPTSHDPLSHSHAQPTDPALPSQREPTFEPIAAPVVLPATGGTKTDDIFLLIERLADLRKKEILTAAEFETKKTELLARL